MTDFSFSLIYNVFSFLPKVGKHITIRKQFVGYCNHSDHFKSTFFYMAH